MQTKHKSWYKTLRCQKYVKEGIEIAAKPKPRRGRPRGSTTSKQQHVSKLQHSPKQRSDSKNRESSDNEVSFLKDHVNVNNIFLMNFTETWLMKEIQDKRIPWFTMFRNDSKSKKKVKGGGAVIYLKYSYKA